VLGEQFSLVDASLLASVGFARRHAELFEAVAARPAVTAWLERVKAVGTGERFELDADEALEIASASTPRAQEVSDGSDPDGLQPGEQITVSADDYGRDAISGVAVVVTRQEIALRREDERLGELVVHFPRAGFRVRRA
jgi:hypothetical protein